MLSSGRYGPESFVRVLTAEDPPPVVIGGQAVNLWALWALERHDHEYPRSRLAELDRLAPFTSRDCDVLGDRELLHRLAAKSGWPATVFPHGASRAVGYLVSPDDQGLMVEILHSVRGLGPDTAGLDVTIVRGGRSYRTLNPFAILEAKLANAIEIPQEDRQDVKHVRIMVQVVHAYMVAAHRAVVDGEEEARILKKLLKRLGRITSGDHARSVSAKDGIDFGTCYPWDVFGSSPVDSVRAFSKFQRDRHSPAS